MHHEQIPKSTAYTRATGIYPRCEVLRRCASTFHFNDWRARLLHEVYRGEVLTRHIGVSAHTHPMLSRLVKQMPDLSVTLWKADSDISSVISGATAAVSSSHAYVGNHLSDTGVYHLGPTVSSNAVV